MNAKYFFLSLFLLAVVAGCDSAETRTVTEGTDADAIAAYEAELANVTGDDSQEEGEDEDK